MKIKSKMLITNLCIGLLPMFIVGMVAIWMIFNTLEDQAYQQLEGRREIKKSQTLDYLTNMFNQLEILKDNEEMQATYLDFDIEDMEDWGKIKSNDDFLMFEEMRKPNLKKWLEGNFWDDILFIDRSGRILYNLNQGEGLGSQIPTDENKIQNAISNTNLAKAFNELKKKITSNEKGYTDFNYVISDLGIYPPFNKPDKPVMFFLANIKSSEPNTFNGYIAFMVSYTGLNDIVSQRDGMGRTGEAYIVGDDLLMRTDSFTKPKDYSAGNSLQKNIKVDTVATQEAIQGISANKTLFDYTGNKVLSSYTPIKFKDLNWALIVEKEQSESFETIYQIFYILLVISIVCVAVVVGISLFASYSITKPLGGEPQDMAEITHKISQGDLQIDFPSDKKISGLYENMKTMVEVLQSRIATIESIATGDLTTDVSLITEKDSLGKAIQTMVDDLTSIIKTITDESNNLSEFSNELSEVSIQMAEESTSMNDQSGIIASAVEEMSSNISSVAEAIKQVDSDINRLLETANSMSNGMADTTKEVKDMSASIEEVALKATEALNISNQAQDSSNNVTKTMDILDNSVGEIGEVTEIIKEIAQQTNLLALNANIEAASAGDAGKGFAVVAQEIKELAKQSAGSAEDITQKIMGIQEHAKNAVSSIHQVVQIIQQINESSELINSLTKNQAASAHQISSNVEASSDSLKNTSVIIGQVKDASANISGNSQELTQGIREISKTITGIHQSSGRTKNGSNTVKEKTQKLVEMSTDLNQLAGKFKV